MADLEKAPGFREELLPNLEALLHHSLTLTQNGREAAGLMSEAMAVALRSWDASMLEGTHANWLHTIVTQQFHERLDKSDRQRTPISPPDHEVMSAGAEQRPQATSDDSPLPSGLTNEWGDDVHYFKAIAELPELFRPALILSYLDGISNSEIADRATADPSTVEPSISEGRRFIREELFSHLMSQDGPGGVSVPRQTV